MHIASAGAGQETDACMNNVEVSAGTNTAANAEVKTETNTAANVEVNAGTNTAMIHGNSVWLLES